MRRTILLAGVLPFVSAFLGGVLAFSLVAAPPATAQSSEAQEVRASAFTLVGPDGTVLARLGPGGASGNGNLTLYDAAGTRRLTMNGAGLVVAYEQDGNTAAFRAGRQFAPGAGGSSPAGSPPVNGVELGPDGSISMIQPSP
jgi:hypothetical protein